MQVRACLLECGDYPGRLVIYGHDLFSSFKLPVRKLISRRVQSSNGESRWIWMFTATCYDKFISAKTSRYPLSGVLLVTSGATEPCFDECFTVLFASGWCDTDFGWLQRTWYTPTTRPQADVNNKGFITLRWEVLQMDLRAGNAFNMFGRSKEYT